MSSQEVQRRETYVCLNYGCVKEDAVPEQGRVDFSQLKRADYRKEALILNGLDQPLTVTNREVLHLIKATEKQSTRVFRGGWFNVFFCLPALLGWLARRLEVRHTTKELLHAALGDICPKATLDKLLSRDLMLARFFVRGLIDSSPCLSKETAAALIEGWSSGQLTSANFDAHCFDVAVLTDLLPKDASKDSPGLRTIRQAILAIEAPREETQPPSPLPAAPAEGGPGADGDDAEGSVATNAGSEPSDPGEPSPRGASPLEEVHGAEDIGEQPLTAEELAPRRENAFLEKMQEQLEVMHGGQSSDDEVNAAAVFILDGSQYFRPEDAVLWISDVMRAVNLDDNLMSRACGMALDLNLADIFNAAVEAQEKSVVLEAIYRIVSYGSPEESRRACEVALGLDLVGSFVASEQKVKNSIIDLLYSVLLSAAVDQQTRGACEMALQLDLATIFNASVTAKEKEDILEIINRMMNVGSKEQKRRACEMALRLDLAPFSVSHLHQSLFLLGQLMYFGDGEYSQRACELFLSLDLIKRVSGDDEARGRAEMILSLYGSVMLNGSSEQKTRAFLEIEKLDLLAWFRRADSNCRKTIIDLFKTGLQEGYRGTDDRFSRMAMDLGAMLAGPTKTAGYLEDLEEDVVRPLIETLAESGPEEFRATARSWLEPELRS